MGGKVGILVGASIGLLACLGLLLGTTPAGAAPPAVSITGLAYAPQTLTVPVGTQVTWTNNETATPHSVTSDTGAFDSSPNCPSPSSACLAPGTSFSFTFQTAGTFAYHCRVHSFMHGQIVVTAETPTPTATAPSVTPTPTPSFTPTPTPTATPTPSPTLTPAPAPSASTGVLGNGVTRSALPVTGPSDIDTLLLVSAVLLFVGAVLLVPRR